jgi:AraC-like DNA-binding protein
MKLHNHPYCRYMKSCDGNASCAKSKHWSMHLAGYGRRICGFCPHGMWEVVQPVIFRGELAAIVYAGGFLSEEKHRALSAGGVEISRSLPPVFEPSMREQICRLAAFLAEFIRCELELCAVAAPGGEKHHETEYYCKLVQDMIAIRYNEDITLTDAAALCNLNPNYLSSLLQKHLGRSFRQLLTEQRLTEAEACIKYQALTFHEIAEKCGFRDANYFSQVFRKSRGISPTDYRNDWVNADREMYLRRTAQKNQEEQ